LRDYLTWLFVLAAWQLTASRYPQSPLVLATPVASLFLDETGSHPQNDCPCAIPTPMRKYPGSTDEFI